MRSHATTSAAEDVPKSVEFEATAPDCVVVKWSYKKRREPPTSAYHAEGGLEGHEQRKAGRNTDFQRGGAESKG